MLEDSIDAIPFNGAEAADKNKKCMRKAARLSLGGCYHKQRHKGKKRERPEIVTLRDPIPLAGKFAG